MEKPGSFDRDAVRIVIGIDPAKDSFVAAIWRAQAKRVTREPALFDNTLEGFEAFATWLERHGCAREHLLVTIENTGRYCEELAVWLCEAGYETVMVDPLSLWRAFRREAKTDALDSALLAEYGWRYRDRLRPFIPPTPLVARIRTLLGVREQLVKQKTALKNHAHSLSSGATDTPAALHVIEESVHHLEEQIQTLERKMKELVGRHARMARHVAHLMSAPGVGVLLAMNLLVLTEGFTRRLGHRRLAAYLGIAPHPHRSGTSVRKRDRSRGFGPAIARKLLHLAARTLKRNNEGFRRYAKRKELEGKPYLVISNNIANKLLKILCALVRHDMPYVENYRSVNPRWISA